MRTVAIAELRCNVTVPAPVSEAMMLRFIPYTVVGGFLAGSGILILQERGYSSPPARAPPTFANARKAAETTRTLLSLQSYRHQCIS